jgi:23S rRNA (adenine1618-N6)-methyltransferase
VFRGIIKPDDRFDLTLCNPPFHASAADAQEANQRKRNKLDRNTKDHNGNDAGDTSEPSLNFGGQSHELWCEGGELGFLTRMITESVEFSQQVYCFTSLISRKENVTPLKKLLARLGAERVEIVTTSQGQKVSRLIAWSFLTVPEQQAWFQQGNVQASAP